MAVACLLATTWSGYYLICTSDDQSTDDQSHNATALEWSSPPAPTVWEQEEAERREAERAILDSRRAAIKAQARRPLRLTLTLTLRDATGREAAHSGAVDVALPYFDRASPQHAVVPITLTGDFAACMSITFTRGDPDGHAPDYLSVTVHDRWEFQGASPRETRSGAPKTFRTTQSIDALDGTLSTIWDVSWADHKTSAELTIATTSSTKAVAKLPDMEDDHDDIAIRSCARALPRRVVSSVRDF